jgi:hypothetical protein
MKQQHLIVSLALLAASCAQAGFRPGEVWLDTDGKPIQAHSAGLLADHGTYYWYGEDKTLGNGNKRGIGCYSSTDLEHWKNEGLALPKEAMPPLFRDDGIVERPKVIQGTSGCTGWAPNAANYATADSMLGPWETKPNPCVGADADKTFHGQSTFVLPVAGKPGCFIFMADRWFKDKLNDSRYIWLPLTMQPDGTFTLAWHDHWDLSIFK